MNKINYPKIEEYNKEKYFYDYVKNYIREFKNEKDKIELSYLCAKEIIELTKENKELYENCVKCLESIKLWLKDENSINIQELKRIANSIHNSKDIICCVYSIIDSANSIIYSCDNSDNSIYIVSSALFYVYKTKPELLTYIQKLIQMYLRTEKQFDIKEYNNTYYENILKQIVNTDYNELNDVDKNQTKDIINEFYNIELNEFNFLIYKTIQKEFM